LTKLCPHQIEYHLLIRLDEPGIAILAGAPPFMIRGVDMLVAILVTVGIEGQNRSVIPGLEHDEAKMFHADRLVDTFPAEHVREGKLHGRRKNGRNGSGSENTHFVFLFESANRKLADDVSPFVHDVNLVGTVAADATLVSFLDEGVSLLLSLGFANENGVVIKRVPMVDSEGFGVLNHDEGSIVEKL